LGICGDATDPTTCLGCALEGPCVPEYDACVNSIDCIDYVTCIDPCFDQACIDACASAYPFGAALYNGLVNCAICVECYFSCDGPGSGCP
jgi:hypothetical protein